MSMMSQASLFTNISSWLLRGLLFDGGRGILYRQVGVKPLTGCAP